MTSRRLGVLILAALACVLLRPIAASAQSAFSGSVKDTSGAVLPGVTVEAASPVLILPAHLLRHGGRGIVSGGVHGECP